MIKVSQLITNGKLHARVRYHCMFRTFRDKAKIIMSPFTNSKIDDLEWLFNRAIELNAYRWRAVSQRCWASCFTICGWNSNGR